MVFDLRKIKLIIGLGNPGPQYENTYHNVGALFAKYFKNFIYAQRFIDWKLLIPAVAAYVNESGRFVVREMKKESVLPEQLLVVHDDSDLEIGTYKKPVFNRGSAGHHGVESVMKEIAKELPNENQGFWRLRIGIRPNTKRHETGEKHETARIKASEFVLKKISAADKKILERVFEDAKTELVK